MEQGKITVDLPGETRERMKKPLNKMSDAELQKALSEIDDVVTSLSKDLEEAKKADPFWFYQPSTGEIGPTGRGILAKYLKPEDIPEHLDGQIHVHASRANVKLVSGGNQSGKTTTCSIEGFIKGCRVVPPSLENVFPKELIPTRKFNRIRVICEDYEHGLLNHNLPVYKNWVPREWLIDGKWEKSYKDKQDTLTLVHPEEKQICGVVEFMTNRADVQTFQGPPIDKVIYDEEPRKDIHEENLLRFVTADRLDMVFGMTPTNGLTWVYEDIFESERTKDGKKSIECFQLPSLGNAKANLEILSEILDRIHVYDHLKMRLLGAWISLSGLVYGALFRKRLHVIDPSRLVEKGGYIECNCPHVREMPGVDPYRSEHAPGCPFLSWITFSALDPHTVTATAMAFLAMDRAGNFVVDHCDQQDWTTAKIKEAWHQKAKYRRMAWSRIDPASDSDLKTLDNRNIFKELITGKDRIPRLLKADKGPGSIKTGIDVIKTMLEINPLTGRPRLLIADRPENEPLMTSFRTLQKDTYANEDKKGPKDAIAEGKHHHHAVVRYIFQAHMRFIEFQPPSYSPFEIPEEAYL